MTIALCLILFLYFFAGAITIIFINKKKTKEEQKQNWLKYFTYFVIINALFASILINPVIFHYLAIVIIFVGYWEIVRPMMKIKSIKIGTIALLFFTLGFWGFYKFSLLDQPVLLYVLFTVTVFDALSQLTGQLFGKRKLLPYISPNKTAEGLIGGTIFCVITSILIRELLSLNVIQSLILGTGIAAFAFIGDTSASFIKRKFGVKDYSNLIPGHGGFLDRFDSLIFSGLFVYVIHIFFNIC